MNNTNTLYAALEERQEYLTELQQLQEALESQITDIEREIDLLLRKILQSQ